MFVYSEIKASLLFWSVDGNQARSLHSKLVSKLPYIDLMGFSSDGGCGMPLSLFFKSAAIQANQSFLLQDEPEIRFKMYVTICNFDFVRQNSVLVVFPSFTFFVFSGEFAGRLWLFEALPRVRLQSHVFPVLWAAWNGLKHAGVRWERVLFLCGLWLCVSPSFDSLRRNFRASAHDRCVARVAHDGS
jgi:hypothetical protein